MKLTSRQCRTARSLLKWNVYDLSSRVSIHFRRIDSFEKGMTHIIKSENDELVEVFTKNGIHFGVDFEVTLVDAMLEDQHMEQGAGAHIVIEGGQMVKESLNTPLTEEQRDNLPEEKK